MQQHRLGVAVRHRAGADHDGDQQAEGVGHDEPLPPVDLLPGDVATTVRPTVSAPFTVWESEQPRAGSGLRPSASRIWPRTVARISSVTLAELGRQVGRTSCNSLAATHSRRRSRGARSGGPGATVATASRVSSPARARDDAGSRRSRRDRRARAVTSQGCDAGLTHAPPRGVVRRQVHDIARIGVRITENRLHRRLRRCTHPTAPPLRPGPARRPLPARTCALATCWSTSMFSSSDRRTDRRRDRRPLDRMGHLDPGSTAAGVAGANAAITEQARAAPVIHVDEHQQHQRRPWWLYVAATPTLTAYHLHRPTAEPRPPSSACYPATAAPPCTTASPPTTPATRPARAGSGAPGPGVGRCWRGPSGQIWPHQAIRARHGLNTAAHHAREQGGPPPLRRQRMCGNRPNRQPAVRSGDKWSRPADPEAIARFPSCDSDRIRHHTQPGRQSRRRACSRVAITGGEPSIDD